MKDFGFWLAAVMALVPFLEQIASDPAITGSPWLATGIGIFVAAARLAYKWHNPTVQVKVPTEGTKTVVVSSDKSIVNVQ